MDIKIGDKIINLPDDYDPRKSEESYMCDYDLAYFKNVLQRRLQDVQAKLAAENIADDSVDRRSADEADFMSIETDTLNELRSKDRLRKLSRKIEEFIGKIDRGIYGYCEECGEEIGRKRLCYNPLARYCITDQSKKDEEEALKEQSEWNERGESSNYTTDTMDSYRDDD